MKASLEQQKIWFEGLYRKRDRTARTVMNDFAVGNMWHGIVERYSDQAHFIYELLQNANDVQATKASFNLKNDGLYFTHNGKRHFWISNPDTENEDQNNQYLGDINAITAVAQSNKKDSSTIGKFGIGFKAVFQYTDTPHIYDPNFKFKIERYIVPVSLTDDISTRVNDKTLFYFPFNKEGISPKLAYDEILGKLKSLVYPTLFLSHLQIVEWTTSEESGLYQKRIIENNESDNINYQLLEFVNSSFGELNNEKLYLFSRLTKNQLPYSVGFFLDKNQKLAPKRLSAFCYFPTKEDTKLNFIIHAPFLLTDNRERIKEYENHNILMVDELAALAADSMCILRDLKLIDDNTIKDIMPYDESDFYKINYHGPDEELLFAPFYDKIKDKIETENLLPAKDEYAHTKNAYWPQDSPVLALFSDTQLAQLSGNENAKWVFRNFVRNQANDDLKDYIDSCVEESFEIRVLFNRITAEFIEQQNEEWLHKLYAYIAKNSNYWDNLKTKPIFLNENKSAVPAYERQNGAFHNVLFFPSKFVDADEKTIYAKLLENDMSKAFFQSIGIKEADLKDEIYTKILPLYDTDDEIDTAPHFELFFKYYKEECPREEQNNYINLLKDKHFISCNTEDGSEYRSIGEDIYYPLPELKLFFKNTPEIYFLCEDAYTEFIDNGDKDLLYEFFSKIGVTDKPRTIKSITEDSENFDIIRELKLNEGIRIHNRRYEYTTRIADYTIEGLEEVIENINIKNSMFLWNYVSGLSDCYIANFSYAVSTYNENSKKIASNIIRSLRTAKWLFTKNGEVVSPNEIIIKELAEGYNIDTPNASNLIDLLNFQPLKELTEDQKAIKFLADNDIGISELEEFLKWKSKQKEKLSDSYQNRNDNSFQKNTLADSSKRLKDIDEFIKKTDNNSTRTKDYGEQQEQSKKEPIELNRDEEFEKEVANLEDKYKILEGRESLKQKVNENTKYSYDWFNNYIQLLTTYTEKQDAQKQKSISFQEIDTYKSDNKYFILRGANNYIPSDIENAEDFKVTLVFGRGKRENIKVEGVSKKGQDLLIYCPDSLPKSILSNLPDVLKADIKFTPIIDLLDRLYKAFSNENYIDSWEDFEEAFPALHYVYGPPGTGKTTTICRNIDEILKDNPKGKILVLTPTNKAADVVSKKLVEIDSSIAVKRLSHPTDPELEESIYIDILDSDQINSINVLASTIHRLPYFNILGEGLLFQYDWDYVIFDEASMTGLHYIVFAIMALYKYNPNIKFIVSGDPKQIPPVLEVNDKILEEIDFQEENIYRMMNLNSFKPEEQSLRDIDTIENLTTQYRSVHHIGQLYSEFSYSNLLKHNRLEKTNDAKKQLPDKFKKIISSAVTFIDIPLDRNNSIYGINRLFYSSYHIYSAILVAEIIKYFDYVNDSGESWSIGLVSPYKAQAVLMSKLLASYGLSENISVLADTVHGFQGDECDIVFFVCNPNGYSYSGNRKALLSKEYIYNVAISRARDYLVVLHPYNTINNNAFINQIATTYNSNFGNVSIIQSNQIQEEIFDDASFIENNSFISGHDNVNVFGITDMKYFIKSSESAIDIQLRDIGTNKNDTLSLDNKSENSEEATIKNEENGDIYRPTEVKLQGLKILGKIEL